jgi:hypothetical protein
VIAVPLFAFIAAQALIFAQATRLPLVAGWDELLPAASAAQNTHELHSVRRSGGLRDGDRKCRRRRTTGSVSVVAERFRYFYALAYLAMFALPLAGRQREIAKPALWLQADAASVS